MTAQYVLYGGSHSLFTGKARAYLRYKGVAFREESATRDVYKRIILPRVGAPIVPVLITPDGECVQDTTDIIDLLETRYPASPVYPEAPLQRLVALMLEVFGDEWLTIPAMHYRWSVLDQQYDFIMGEFGRMSHPEAEPDEAIALGEKLSQPFSGMLPPLGVTEATIPGIEKAYLQLLDDLEAHFRGHDYLLGSRPSIGDYGLMGPLYAHLARDPVPKALMQSRAPAVYAWVERMNDPIVLSGDFLPDDAVPDTLLPVLGMMCRDQLPDIAGVIAANAAFVEANPGADVPRFLGMQPFQFGSARGERVISSYAQWLFQRPWGHYQSLSGDARTAADELLASVGGEHAFSEPIRHRLERKSGQLELVEASTS
ncbi:MAG: glutathione S-transferase family protein [Pseudomonadota bacterium]